MLNPVEKISIKKISGSDIKVFVVDDSALARKVMSDIINKTPGMRVIGTAENGKQALERIVLTQPDIVCTDFHMPVMDGEKFIEQLMKIFPLPVLAVSIAVQKNDTENIFNLLKAGALDVVAKPRLNAFQSAQTIQLIADELTSKIRILSGVYVFRRNPNFSERAGAASASSVTAYPDQNVDVPKIVVIGASTGGPQILKELFIRLKWPRPFSIVCVQHISEGFQEGLLCWLGEEIHHVIELAVEGKTPCAGHIYFAAENHHLEFDAGGCFHYNDDAPQEGARPASDVLFTSAAKRFGKNVLAILLSGMGRDGAVGLKRIADAGGITVAQNEESCIVFGMPRAAIEMGAARFTLGPADIAALLNKNFH